MGHAVSSLELEPVYSRQEVLGLMDDALAIVGELEVEGDLKAEVFRAAVQALSMRRPKVPAVAGVVGPASLLGPLQRH